MNDLSENKKNLAAISIGINVILGIALIILYILYFNEPVAKPVKKRTVNNTETASPFNAPTGSIAFVNSDEILNRYELVEKLASDLDKEHKQKDADLQAKKDAYEKDAAYFQESVSKQNLSEESAQRIYEQLMAKQQKIYDLQDKYSNDLAQKEYEMNMTLLDSIRNYLKRMNATSKYDYVLNYNTSGSVLLARDTFDITEIVLQGLNKEYKDQYSSGK